jgi:23S rRNA (guanine745-N1)-methyltransferase
METIYKCPVCGHRLTKVEKVLVCDQRHSYDIASQGYVNLILANQKRSQESGDDKGMVQNRTYFLGLGHYNRLSDKVNEAILGFVGKPTGLNKVFNILDLGCGEGYYTERLQGFLEKKCPTLNFHVWGVDVSKSAIQKAARRNPKIQCCVGNNYRLPYLDGSVDFAFSIFSPFDPKELMRVLKAGGKIIVVRPGASHLGELVSLLYQKFELQGDSSNLPETFGRQPIDEGHVKYQIHLRSKKDIESLIGMTPYYWSLGEEKKSLLAEKTELETTVDFQWSVFQK